MKLNWLRKLVHRLFCGHGPYCEWIQDEHGIWQTTKCGYTIKVVEW